MDSPIRECPRRRCRSPRDAPRESSRLADLADLMKRAARLETSREEKKPGDPTRLGNLGEKSFYYLSEEEIRKMKEAVTRLAQRLMRLDRPTD